MSPKVPDAYKQARLEEILTAAEDSFIEKGLHTTTMQDIYRRSELSPGAVYNYFPSKEEIIIAVVRRFNEWSRDRLTELITDDGNESLLTIFRFWLDMLRPTERKQTVAMQLDFYSEATRNELIRQALIASQDATHAVLTALIIRNQREGKFDPGLDAEALARAIMSLIFGIAIHKSLEPDIDLDAYREVCETFLRATFITPAKKKEVK